MKKGENDRRMLGKKKNKGLCMYLVSHFRVCECVCVCMYVCVCMCMMQGLVRDLTFIEQAFYHLAQTPAIMVTQIQAVQGVLALPTLHKSMILHVKP